MRVLSIVTLLLLLCSASGLQAQGKFLCRSGHIWFSSHTPLEDIEAHNNEAASVITPSTGDIAFQVLIKSFRFKRALMEEHFNENYMESDKYPKSDFKGKIVNLDSINFSKPGSYRAVVEGTLTIHNVPKPVKATGVITVTATGLTATASFAVVPQDFGIEIPGVVKDKIAKTIAISVDMSYTPYARQEQR